MLNLVTKKIINLAPNFIFYKKIQSISDRKDKKFFVEKITFLIRK
jgi:hypothetical protein